MESCGHKLNELNMTEDEVKRFKKAFKDEKFREMLTDYAKEISNPDKKKRYEDEIKQLEQERGIYIDFIHPNPFRVLRTSVNGKQKCFINICTNEKVGKPTFDWGIKDNIRGQYWSMPQSINCGREERDTKGNQFKIYDVVFHPDTLHIASRNTTFMDMVDNNAIQAIEDNLNVILDKRNVRVMKIKYKGTPQPCVIRKPIPGYKAEDQANEPDSLAFPYPYKEIPNTATPQATEVPASKHRGVSEVKLQNSKVPTTPHYTVKYRSFIDLQDYRCSRDSAPSPRPNEIVVTVDMPLLQSARDTSLKVNGKSLVLESETPAYRLEVYLAYPVDEDKGEAKFSKHTGKLTVTLPVLPASETFVHTMGLTQTDDNSQGEEYEAEIRGAEQEEQRPKEWVKSDEMDETEDVRAKLQAQSSRQQNREDEISDKEESRVTKGGVWCKEGLGEGEKCEEGKSEQGTVETNKGSDEERCDRAENTKECSVNSFHGDTEVIAAGQCSEENSSEQGVVFHCADGQPEAHKLYSSRGGGAEQTSTSHISVDTEEFRDGKLDTVDTTPSALDQPSSDEYQTETSDATEPEPDLNQDCTTQGIPESKRVANPNQGGAVDPEKMEGEEVDEDDLQTEQMCPTVPADCDGKALALLLETDVDGKETVISDHSTSAGFPFQNSLVYELD